MLLCRIFENLHYKIWQENHGKNSWQEKAKITITKDVNNFFTDKLGPKSLGRINASLITGSRIGYKFTISLAPTIDIQDIQNQFNKIDMNELADILHQEFSKRGVNIDKRMIDINASINFANKLYQIRIDASWLSELGIYLQKQGGYNSMLIKIQELFEQEINRQPTQNNIKIGSKSCCTRDDDDIYVTFWFSAMRTRDELTNLRNVLSELCMTIRDKNPELIKDHYITLSNEDYDSSVEIILRTS